MTNIYLYEFDVRIYATINKYVKQTGRNYKEKKLLYVKKTQITFIPDHICDEEYMNVIKERIKTDLI